MPVERFSPDDPREWLNRARSNLARARSGATIPEVYLEDLCFDAQQAAEKALKAVLIHLDVSFPYVHDLARPFDKASTGSAQRLRTPLLTLVKQARSGGPRLSATGRPAYSVCSGYSLPRPARAGGQGRIRRSCVYRGRGHPLGGGNHWHRERGLRKVTQMHTDWHR